MRVKEEGIFKMHSEDKDELLPVAFMQRRHEHEPPMENNNLILIKNWRLRERVRNNKIMLLSETFVNT